MILRPEMVSDNDPHTGPLSLGLVNSTSTILLLDLFAGTNGTNLTSHPMNVGPGWTALSSGFTLSGSGAAVPASTGVCLDVASAGQANVDASVTVNASALTQYVSVVVRCQDANNLFHAVLDLGAGGLGFYLEEISGGTHIQRATYAITPATGTNYTLELKASGTTLTGILNGVPEWTYSSSDFQSQQNCGVRCNLGTAVTFANFQVLAP
jgi:pectate lyase